METLQPVGRHPELQEALMMTMTINDDYEDDNGNDNDEKNSNDNTNHRNQRAKSPLQTREINRSTQIIIAIVNIFNINCSYRHATIIVIIMIIMIFRYFEAKKRSNYVGDMSR